MGKVLLKKDIRVRGVAKRKTQIFLLHVRPGPALTNTDVFAKPSGSIKITCFPAISSCWGVTQHTFWL